MDVPEWIKAIVPFISGAIGILVGIWHAGKKSGKEEADRDLQMNERLSAKVKEAIMPFDETLKGLRQKINDVELDTVKGYVAKGDFNDFREEYREDMRDIKAMISRNGHK